MFMEKIFINLNLNLPIVLSNERIYSLSVIDFT